MKLGATLSGATSSKRGELAVAAANIATFEVNARAAQEVAAEVRALGRRALPVEADVTDLGRVEAAAKEGRRACGTDRRR